MTRDEWAIRILDRVGQRGGALSPIDTVLQTQVQNEFQVQQEELEHGEWGTMPWFLKQEYTNASFATVASAETVAFPTGFLREWDEVRVALFYRDTSVSGDQWIPIAKADYDELKTELGGNANGKPQGYTLFGTSYRLFPTPDAAYPLKALVYVADTSLVTSSQNRWLSYAPQVLVGKVGEVTATVLSKNEVAAAFFAKMHADGLSSLLRDTTAREEAGRGRQMGED